MSTDQLESLLRFIDVDAAREEFGESVYSYWRIHVKYESGRSSRGGRSRAPYHIECPRVACSKEEYDAHSAAGDAKELERFRRGAREFKESYVRYTKTISQPGWPDRLIEMLSACNPLR